MVKAGGKPASLMSERSVCAPPPHAAWASRPPELPGAALLGSALAITVVTLVIPYTRLADPLGFVPLPLNVLVALGAMRRDWREGSDA